MILTTACPNKECHSVDTSSCHYFLGHTVLTFDSETDFIGHALTLRVEHVTRVVTSVGSRDPLHHQTLVTDNNAGAHIVIQRFSLKKYTDNYA